MASEITKEPERKISEEDAVRVLALPPFSIREPMLTSILNEVYPNR